MFGKRRDFPKILWIKNRNGQRYAWEIKWVKVIPGDSVYFETLGICDPNERVIYIKTGQSAYQRAVTFFHEVGHAWEHETGKTLPHDFIEWQAQRMTDFFEDNTQ